MLCAGCPLDLASTAGYCTHTAQKQVLESSTQFDLTYSVFVQGKALLQAISRSLHNSVPWQASPSPAPVALPWSTRYL